MITIKLNMIPPILQLTEVHISTTWEIATDETFTDIIYTHTTSLDLTRHNVPPTDITIPSDQTIFARGRATTNLRIHEFNLATLMFITVMDDTTDGGTGGGTGGGSDFIPTTGTVDATLLYLNWEVRKSDTDQLIWSGDQLETSMDNIPSGTLNPNDNYKIALKKHKVFIPLVIEPPALTVIGAPNNVTTTPILVSSLFALTTGVDVHVSTDWSIEDTAGTVIWGSLNDTVNLRRIEVPTNILLINGTYVFKVRYNGAVGISGYTSETFIVTRTDDLAINQWTGISDYPILAQSGSQSTLIDNRILVVGGRYSQTMVNDSHIYSTITGLWTPMAPYPTTIVDQSQSTLLDGRVLVVGGTTTINWSSTQRKCRIYDPATDTWTAVANYPTPIYRQSQSTLLDGRVLVVGGVVGIMGSTNNANIYDPVTDVWSPAAQYNSAIALQSQSTLLDGRVLVVGGLVSAVGSWAGNGPSTNNCNIYNPTNNTWSVVANYPETISISGQSTLIDGRVLVVGGRGTTPPHPNARANMYDPLTNIWAPVANCPIAVFGHSQSTLYDGRIVVCNSGFEYSGVNRSCNIYTP